MCAALWMCTACTTTMVDGHGTAASGIASRGTSSSPGGGGSLTADRLVALLSPRPLGAVGWDDAWAANSTPTAGQLVARLYRPADRALEVQFLHADGLVGIAHRTWVASDNDQSDLILFSFRTTAGAVARYAHITTAELSEPGARGELVPGVSTSELFRDRHKDADHFVRSAVYIQKGRIVEQAFAFTRPTFDKTEAEAWARKQADRLP